MAPVEAGIRVGSVAGCIPIPAVPSQPEKAKVHPQDCWLCWSLSLSPCLCSARWAGFEFGPWNDSCSRVTKNARLMFAASCPCSVQLAGI